MSTSMLKLLLMNPDLPASVLAACREALATPTLVRLRALVTALVRDTSLSLVEARWLVGLPDDEALEAA